jgi:hypothetical protein
MTCVLQEVNAAHGYIHNDNENCEVYGTCNEPNEVAWYRRLEYQEYGYYNDPGEELDEDTSWAGERREFSDTLMR